MIACGRCATCDAEVVAHRDLLLVAGMRPVQRDRLRAGGITTIDDLAVAASGPKGMNPDTFAMLQTQARLQLSAPAGTGESVLSDPGALPPIPPYEVVAPTALGALPRPDLGDLFFDFEGDPLHTEGDAVVWGIDYLFGWIDVREQYSALWAHSFAEERIALETFLDFIRVHRAQHPDFHIYHYAPYEPTHLLTMAARHGTREADVDRLLRDGVFVDLYPIVRRALRIGSRSYSIKKLEPLYMGDEVRTSDVQKGDDSIVRYAEARALARRRRGRAPRGRSSTIWPTTTATTASRPCACATGSSTAPATPACGPRPTPSRARTSTSRPPALWRWPRSRATHPHDSAEAQALRLGAAGIDYYAREAKTFWATHFLRLREPVSLWEQTRDVIVLDSARCRLVEDWHQLEGQRAARRIVELRGELAPGTRLTEGSNPFALYELPAPFPFEPSPRWIHADHRVTVIDVLDDGALVEETAVDGFTWTELPIALTPVTAAACAQPAGGDRRVGGCRDRRGAGASRRPGHRHPAPPPAADPSAGSSDRRAGAAALARATTSTRSCERSLDLDRSYLAVQGPPGTGKTYVGSHVIARLVNERGYKVGVVAQSHAVIENMLDRVVAAGVAREQVAKAPKDPAATGLSFTPIAKNGVAEFTAAHAGTGFVIGGTAWDFAHEGRVPRGSLDLLVIDEAGQFSLASTIAVSLSSSRLLLLGDPQQLPQVSQGTHPEPVDTSALGWVMDGADVIPPEYGYFLARTWRMHPRVAEPVSRLSYSGELAAHPATARATARRGACRASSRSPCVTTATRRSRSKRPPWSRSSSPTSSGANGPASGSTSAARRRRSRRARSRRPTSSSSLRTTLSRSRSRTRWRMPDSPTFRSAPSIASRDRRPRSRSCRSRRHRDATRPAGSSSCCCAIG